MRWRIVAAMLTVVGLPMAALSDDRSRPQEVQAVTVLLAEYKYAPAYIELRRNRPVELRLVNEGKALHEFVTDALVDTVVDVEGQGVVVAARGLEELEVPASSTVVLRFTPKKVGDFGFRCDAEDPVSHHESGMKGVLTIR
ncbi:MAG: cupredoxin domain-containing protein [Nitrospirota bacterium]